MIDTVTFPGGDPYWRVIVARAPNPLDVGDLPGLPILAGVLDDREAAYCLARSVAVGQLGVAAEDASARVLSWRLSGPFEWPPRADGVDGGAHFPSAACAPPFGG